MTTISNKNIIIGTGRLGRNEGYIEDSKRLQTIDYMLSKGCGIHISPTYGSSFKKLSNINFNKKNRIISKIDFSRNSFPDIQLNLTQKLVNNSQIEVQISGDIRNILSNKNNWSHFQKTLNKYKKKFNISRFYLSPLYHDSEYLLKLSNDSSLKFNLALHYSIVESEFHPKILFKRNSDTKILALRAFGEGIDSYGNWYYPLGMEIKPNQVKENQRKKIQSIKKKYDLDSVNTRLIFALKNRDIDYCALSFSNIDQAKQALSINTQDIENEILRDLKDCSLNYANKDRKGFGFRYPANTTYLFQHSTLMVLNSTLKSGKINLGLRVVFLNFFSRIFKLVYLKKESNN